MVLLLLLLLLFYFILYLIILLLILLFKYFNISFDLSTQKIIILDDHQTIKICITILRAMESSDSSVPNHFVSFSRRAGDRKSYKEIVNNIKSLILI